MDLGYFDSGSGGTLIYHDVSGGGGVPPIGLEEPDPPTGLVATASASGQVTVTFFAPSNDGGSPILGYTVTSIPSGGTDSNAGSSSLSHVVIGLTNGVSYTFTAHATNAVGNSVESAPSNAVTPSLVISMLLVDSNNVPLPNLSGLRGAFWDAITPDAITDVPSDTFTGESTDVNGRLIVQLGPTSLSLGDVCWFNVTNSTGTPIENQPVFDQFSGPVKVS